MTKEELAKAYANEFNKEYQQIAYDAFLCGYGAKCDTIAPEGLEEAAEESASQYYVDGGCSPFPNTEKAAHKAGFIAGAEWMKSKMMEDAKDGYVSAIIIHNEGDEEHYAVTYPNGERPHSITDKVKIIIL